MPGLDPRLSGLNCGNSFTPSSFPCSARGSTSLGQPHWLNAPQFPARTERFVDGRAKHGHDRVRWNRPRTRVPKPRLTREDPLRQAFLPPALDLNRTAVGLRPAMTGKKSQADPICDCSPPPGRGSTECAPSPLAGEGWGG